MKKREEIVQRAQKLLELYYKLPPNFGKLTPRRLGVLQMRAEGKTLKECGAAYDVMAERARQIEAKAINWILRRHAHYERGIDPP